MNRYAPVVRSRHGYGSFFLSANVNGDFTPPLKAYQTRSGRRNLSRPELLICDEKTISVAAGVNSGKGLAACLQGGPVKKGRGERFA